MTASGPPPHLRHGSDSHVGGSEISLLDIAAGRLGFSYAVERADAWMRTSKETGEAEGVVPNASHQGHVGAPPAPASTCTS